MSIFDALFAENIKSYKCPDCGGLMAVTEWSADEREVHFKCINNHTWIKKD